MKRIFGIVVFLSISVSCFCWGFYAHRRINYYAVFLLPPEMLVLYKPYIEFLSEHAVDPDKRRYAIPDEAPRHYIDIDRYGAYPFRELPRKWEEAVAKYSEDTLLKYGIVPWWVQTMLKKLTRAFKEKNQAHILQYSAEIGHYIADAHVPLHACSNHDGQYSDQKGIHAFWESRIPELFAEKPNEKNGWDFLIGKAEYLKHPDEFIWNRILESAAAADTVLRYEKELSLAFAPDLKFSFEERNGVVTRQYSTAYCKAYQEKLNGMIERRMRESVFAVASFWYTAWVNAGQPDLTKLNRKEFTAEEMKAFEALHEAWKKGKGYGRDHE
ncbi:MAG: zinc dependent phospholipase C family protein [Chitinophagaceae bacterium]|nr:zinc dependent phospholipase C family protein [Chitinophagaceae bacterium]